MAVLRELVVLLGFKVDRSGQREYEAITGDVARKAERDAERSEAAAVRMGQAFARAAMAIGTAIVTAGAAVALAGDKMTANLNKLESQLTGVGEAEAMYWRIYDVVRQTGASAGETTTAFLRYNLAMQKLGKSSDDALTLVSGLQAGLTMTGATTGEVNSVMLQLGQALGSGKLQGDELRSLRENMPMLVEEIRKSLGVTDEEFKKLAENGELTAAKLYEPLMTAARRYREQLTTATPTMARSWAKFSNVLLQTLADIDRRLGLSQGVARFLDRATDALERFRQSIGAILSWLSDLYNRLGGAETAAKLAAVAFGALVGAFPGILAGVAGLTVALGLLLARLALVALPVLAIAATLLILDDAFAWIMGKPSLLEEKFGTFEALTQRVAGWFGDAARDMQAHWAPLEAFFTTTVPGWVEWGVAMIRTAWAGLVLFFENAWGRIAGVFEAGWARIKPVVDLVVGAIKAVTPAAVSAGIAAGVMVPGAVAASSNADMAARIQQRQAAGFQGGALGFAQVDPASLARAQGAAGNTTNQVENKITVNAPGADPASVAAASQQGVGRAMDRSLPATGTAARGIVSGAPRLEPAER